MTVALNVPADLQEFVEGAVKSGRFSVERELVREALEALKTQEEFRQFQLAGLKEKLLEGLDDLEGGRVEEWDGEAVKRKGRALLAAQAEIHVGHRFARGAAGSRTLAPALSDPAVMRQRGAKDGAAVP